MPLHPQVKAVIAKRDASVPPPSPDASLAELRERFMDTWRESGPEVASLQDRTIPGPGGPLPIRIYRSSTSEVLPVLMSFHGGGFVFGGVDAYDGNARRLAAGADCCVVTVEYRLAPEHRFPAAPEDCYAATRWVADNAIELGIDPDRIAVGGDSAGANLSTVVAMMARDRGGPPLVLQILMVPTVHPTWDEMMHDPEETPPSGREWWWGQYLNDPTDAANAYAAPLSADDLSGLPPALVVTAEYDDLLGEGHAYAAYLEAAGVPTEYRMYEGMWHIFHMYPSSIDLGREAVDAEIAAMRKAFYAETGGV